jgi:hypothetical protein
MDTEMRKLLQNPKVVAFLVLLAIGYLYWNIVHPMIISNSPEIIEIEEKPTNQAPHLQPTQNSNHHQEDFTRPESQPDSNSPSLQHALGAFSNFVNTQFEYTRDPFKKQKRGFKRYTAFDFLPRSEQKRILALRIKQKNQRIKTIRKPKNNSTFNTKKTNTDGLFKHLEAIAIGTHTDIALINGKKINISKNNYNNLDTITIIQSNKTNHFVFKP